MIYKLYGYVNKYRKYAILAPLTVIGEVLLEISIPLLMSKIVDVGIPNKDLAFVVKTGFLMVLMALFSLTLGAFSSRFASMASMGFASEIRAALFNKVQSYSFSNMDHFSSASLVTRLTTDVANAQNAFQMTIRMLVRAPVMLVGATIMALSINNSLVAVFLVAIPILAAALFIIIRLAYPRFISMLKKYDKLNASVQENLIAIRVVKAFVRSAHEKEKFRQANQNLMNASLRAEKIIICNAPVMQLTMYGCIMAILWYGGNMIVVGSMLTGELISFINYVTQILMSLMMISMAFTNLVLSQASIKRICEVLDETPDIQNAPDAGSVQVKDGAIVFKNVCFRYSQQANIDTLHNINLTIRSGETIGVIGGTGSAKTTLVQLIPRLYDVTQGEVIVGGHNVKEYHLDTLRNTVSMVLQKNVLFSGTIRDNLRWGDQNASEEEIIEACKAAAAHDFIMSFPEGYETFLGQGGVNVSGGQKQRLCIARALLKKPKILILDDSTSAVDTATDAQIRNALKNGLSESTKVIIAQRITSVCDADRIVVMDAGEISAVGTHEELLQSSEIYREVYHSQQKGVAEDGAS